MKSFDPFTPNIQQAYCPPYIPQRLFLLQMISPSFLLILILINCLVTSVLILLGEITPWSLLEVRGLKESFLSVT